MTTPKTIFDINSPPVPFEGDDDDYDRKSLNYWGNHQDDRLKGLGRKNNKEKDDYWWKNTDTKSGNKGGKKQNKDKKFGTNNQNRRKTVFQAFPVVEYDDDAIPQGVSGSVTHAADALLCRDTVVDYVINATDLKDECDGLKKAFTKTCTDEEDEVVEEMPAPSSRSKRRRQRFLETTTKDDYRWRQSYEPPRRQGQEINPLIQWQFQFH